MKIKLPLDDMFNNPNSVRILRHLTLYPSPVLTGRGLAKELGMSQMTCHRALGHLVDIGIVTRRTIGRSSTYEVARDSLYFREILEPIFGVESGLLEGFVNTLVKGIKGRIHTAYLFGSVARGDDTTHSDVDILLILKKGVEKEKVREILESNIAVAYTRYRVGGSVLIYGLDEFERMKMDEHPLIMEVLDEGILLAGKEVQ